jgi:2-oxoglutarate ferredoxin oxidoreductase subunit alpha
MQARWGSHGDYPVVVLTPASVFEIYQQAVRAFEIAETCRVPVILLYDQAVAQLTETVELPDSEQAVRVERKWASGPAAAFKPYAAGADGIPAMPRPGGGYRCHTTGLIHAESGFPTQTPEVVERNLTRLLTKLDLHRSRIDAWQALDCEDADVLVVALGISARAAARAVATCRKRGVRAGLFRPITLWPFPEDALRRAASRACAVLVPELNAGQLRLEVERILGGKVPIASLRQINGNPLDPADIASRILALAQPQARASGAADPCSWFGGESAR